MGAIVLTTTQEINYFTWQPRNLPKTFMLAAHKLKGFGWPFHMASKKWWHVVTSVLRSIPERVEWLDAHR